MITGQWEHFLSTNLEVDMPVSLSMSLGTPELQHPQRSLSFPSSASLRYVYRTGGYHGAF